MDKGKYKLRKKSDSGMVEVFSLNPLILPIEALFDRIKAQKVVAEILTGA